MVIDPIRVLVAGTCVLDVRVGPVALDVPLKSQAIRVIDAPQESVGGVVGNVGIQLARLGLDVSVATQIGGDGWGRTMRQQLDGEGIDTTRLTGLAGASSGVSFCWVGIDGDRVFMTSPGPHKRLDAAWLLAASQTLVRGDVLVLAYYSRLKLLEAGLPQVLAGLSARGVRVVMDAAGDGGTMRPLSDCLPHLWIYAPSYEEARAQTGQREPGAILDTFRACSPGTVLALKHGRRGAFVDDGKSRLHQPALSPPGPVVDSVGAGDAFVAGFTAALARGVGLAEAARFAAANASWSLTGPGGWQAAGDWERLRAFAAQSSTIGPGA